MTTVLVVEDEPTPRKYLSQILVGKGYDTTEAETLASAAQAIAKGLADIVLLDLQLPDGNGLSLLPKILQHTPGLPVIVVTANNDVETAVDAMQAGAFDFVSKPIQLTRLERALARADDQVRVRRELHDLRQRRNASGVLVLGSSPAMQHVRELLERAAPANASVLITGESGTGKEVVAQTLHNLSPRRDRPWMPVNCAAIPDQLLESELFGYEAGAFTGATKRKEGVIESADGGTLFLDEISGMRLDLQAKLLRVLEDHRIRRVGGAREVAVDIRVISAANRDLKQMVADGTFREDLFYRLKVVEINLPPLRERSDDIPEFAGAFLNHFNREMGRSVQQISPSALAALRAYHWPGNVRELRNAIERAMLFCDGDTLEAHHLPSDITR